MRNWLRAAAVLAVSAGPAAAQGTWEFYIDVSTSNSGAAVCPIVTTSDFLCFEIGCTDNGGLDFVIASPPGRFRDAPMTMVLQVDGRQVTQQTLQPGGSMTTISEFRAPVGAAGQEALRALELGSQASVTLQSGEMRQTLNFGLNGSMRTIAQAREECQGQPVNLLHEGRGAPGVNILNEGGAAPLGQGVTILNVPGGDTDGAAVNILNAEPEPAPELIMLEPAPGAKPEQDRGAEPDGDIAAPAEQRPRPPEPGAPVDDPLATAFAELQGECTTLDLAPDFAAPIDLNGDPTPDIVLNYGAVRCNDSASWFCGSGGCRTALYLARPGGGYVRIFDGGIRDLNTEAAPRLVLDFHGSFCGRIGAEPCTVTWRVADGRLVEE